MKNKKILLILIIFILYFIFYSISYSYSISNDLEKNLFRLHILANSDSSEDQELKLYVRNKVIDYLHQYSFNNKPELITFLNNNQLSLQKVIDDAIKEKGYSYTSSFEIENSFYPQKQYENITLPAGNYDGLKIKIGKAEGKNWWCVLFPPMCLINNSTCSLPEESEILLDNSLTEESCSVISSNSSKYKFKFKIIEFINNL